MSERLRQERRRQFLAHGLDKLHVNVTVNACFNQAAQSDQSRDDMLLNIITKLVEVDDARIEHLSKMAHPVAVAMAMSGAYIFTSPKLTQPEKLRWFHTSYFAAGDDADSHEGLSDLNKLDVYGGEGDAYLTFEVHDVSGSKSVEIPMDQVRRLAKELAEVFR